MIQLLTAGQVYNPAAETYENTDWNHPSVSDLPGMFWSPDTPSEQPAIDGQPVVQTGTVYGRRHPITETNRIRIPGEGDYQVTGVRPGVRNPFTLATSGMVVTVRRVR